MAKKKGPDRALINRAFQIKPVFADQSGNLHYVAPVDVYDTLITEHQTAGEARGLRTLDTISVEIPLGLRELPRPSIAHVLPEIPKALAKDAVAFQLRLHDQMLSGEDFSVTATVTVYGGTLPGDVRDQPVIARGKTYDKPVPRARKARPAEVFNPAAAAVLQRPVVAPKTAHFSTPKPPAA